MVTITGFPFLTQLASQDFREIRVRAGAASDGSLQIQSLNVTLQQVKLNSSFSGGTVGQASGTATISFAALASEMTAQSGSSLERLGLRGLTLSAAGPSEIKAVMKVAGISTTAVWQVSVTGPATIKIQLVHGGSLQSQLLGSLSTVVLTVPDLPLGLHLTAVRVTQSGLAATIAGQDVSFGS